MNGRRTTIFPLKKLEATLRRDAAFVAWRYGRETRFASWEFPTGKSMRRSTTSRFAPHRTEAIPCERRSGIFVDSSSDSAPCSRGSLWPLRIFPGRLEPFPAPTERERYPDPSGRLFRERLVLASNCEG